MFCGCWGIMLTALLHPQRELIRHVWTKGLVYECIGALEGRCSDRASRTVSSTIKSCCVGTSTISLCLVVYSVSSHTVSWDLCRTGDIYNQILTQQWGRWVGQQLRVKYTHHTAKVFNNNTLICTCSRRTSVPHDVKQMLAIGCCLWVPIYTTKTVFVHNAHI